jgi:hypothetical protein
VFLNGYVHTDRNVSVTFQFRSVAERGWRKELVRTGPNLLDSDNVNSPTCPPVRCECLLATRVAWFFFGNRWTVNRIVAYVACSKYIRPLAGKNTFTSLEICNPNLLLNSLLVTEHTSPGGSAIVQSISGMPLCEWCTGWPSCSV